MLTRQQILDMALELPGATADQPFEEDFDSTVLRHGATRKWFGILLKAPRQKVGLNGDGTADILNLKCDPLLSYGLRQTCKDILPAWHMNKQLWITLRLEGDIPEELARQLLRMSYDLTSGAPRKRRKKQNDDPTV